MIRVYPSLLPGEPLETHNAENITLTDWLSKEVNGFDIKAESQPIVVKVNGTQRPVSEWPDTYITAETVVDIHVAPKSGAVSSVISAVVSVVSSVFSFLTPDVPSAATRQQGQQGQQLAGASAEANQPKLNQVIPDQAGRYKKYPDLLCQPVKRFVNQRSQVLRMFLSLGRGSFDRDTDDLKIGSTPLSSIDGASFQFYEPGASVSGNIASQNWYNAPEVGSSTGSAGLRLRGVTTASGRLDARGSSNGDTLSFVGGYLPPGWAGDVRLTVRIPQPITVSGNQTTITGDFRHLAEDMEIRIYSVSFSGVYVVRTYSSTSITLETTGGTLVDDLPPGDYDAPIDLNDALYAVIERLEDTTQIRLQRYLNADDIDSSWTEFPQVSDAQNIVVDVSDEEPESLWTGPFLACPQQEETNTIQWDIFCPNGLGEIQGDGSIESRSREVELQWRDYGASTWNSDVRTISGATRDQLGFTFSTSVSSLTPEVRVRRLTLESTATTSLDKIEWYGLRSRLSAPSSYADISTLAITITGSDLIASQTENKINIVETRKLNGVATRSIADYARYIMEDNGISTDEYDADEFDRLDDIWQSRGDVFDFVHDGEGTTKEALKRALRPGFAELTIEDSKLTPVRDEPRTQIEHMYTPQNMAQGLKREATFPRPDDIDGVDVEYFDANDWVWQVVPCRLSGDLGIRAEKVRIEGVTNRTRAWRIGMRIRSIERYQRKAYQFSTELDALNSRYMSFDALADDVPGYGQSALVLAVDEDGSDVILTLSEPMDWSGSNHVVAWRRPDGTLSGPYAAERGDADYEVVTQMPDVPVVSMSQELPHALFGTSLRWHYPVLIKQLQPQGFDTVSVTAVNYDERVYANDNNSPP